MFDLKAFLLDALKSKETISKRVRFYVDKKCYCVWYEMTGKFITIKKVKSIVKKSTARNRIKRRKRMLRRRNALREPDSETHIIDIAPKVDAWTETIEKPLSGHASIETQTIRTLYATKGTETDIFFCVARATQTARTFYRKAVTQTEAATVNLAMQTEWKVSKRSTQTELETSSEGTQVDVSCTHVQMQTEAPTESVTDLRAERDHVVHLMNEVAEMVINQNHILQNNSQMLTQVSEFIMLTSNIANRRSHVRLMKKMTKQRRQNNRVKRRIRYRYLHMCRRCKVVETRSIFIQTDRMMCFDLISVYTQVELEHLMEDQSTQTVQYIKRINVGVQVGHDDPTHRRRKFYKLFQT